MAWVLLQGFDGNRIKDEECCLKGSIEAEE
jgi:hypothetical protein